MDSIIIAQPQPTESIFSNKNIIILFLLILLIFSFLGINLFLLFGNFFQSIINLFGPPIEKLLSVFGYTTGTILNDSADIVANVSKTGIDIADGTIHSVGDLLIKASSQGSTPIQLPIQTQTQQQTKDFDKSLNASNIRIPSQPESDSSTNPIQKPMTSNKTKWCLVGEYEGKRGCIAVTDQDKCLSGQVYPSQKLCMNPNLSQNIQ